MGCCEALSGIANDCDTTIGGIRRVWLACRDALTADPVATDGELTTLTFTANSWHEYQMRKQVGSADGDINRNDQNGTLYYETNIVMQFSRQTAAKRNEIAAIAQSDLMAMVLDNNGEYWFYGFKNDVTLTEGTYVTGQAYDDLNGYTLTLQDVGDTLPLHVSASVAQEIIADANPTP